MFPQKRSKGRPLLLVLPMLTEAFRSSSVMPSSPWGCRRPGRVLTTATAITTATTKTATLSKPSSLTTTSLFLYAPPGSGYASLEDEESLLPDTYEPMMEYPGTMRPGRTPENVPFQDLPIGDDDPDPVPWPHFQQIEWHHRWEPPHDHPIPMEDFIELQGRWATPELEATMRAGVRQGIRDRREKEESEKRDTIITDDDEDDDDVPVALGDSVFGQLGSSADQALTAAMTSPDRPEEEDKEDDDEEDGGFGDDFDFLSDLGLDDDDDDGGGTSSTTRSPPPTSVVSDDDGQDEDDNMEEVNPSSDGGVTASIDVDDDSDLDLGLDDDDDLDGVDTVPLEDFGDSDTMDTEDIFDEGGFDFDDGDFDMDGGDMW